MLHLETKIGGGNERNVFLHPFDPRFVVKVKKPDGTYDRSCIEAWYLEKIIGHPCCRYFPQYFGMVETSLGPGHAFECIRNHDGSISETIWDHVVEGTISYSDVREKVSVFVGQTKRHALLLDDLDPTNLVARFRGDSDFDVVMVDGFGPKWVNAKTKLRVRYPWLARMRMIGFGRKAMLRMDAWDETVRSGSPVWRSYPWRKSSR
jgi:hypothetical protein